MAEFDFGPPSLFTSFKAKAVGWGRNWPSLTFHKPLEINCLNHHRCLDTKGVCDLSQVNSSRLFLTPFYSLPMRFAGTSAGTFEAAECLRSVRANAQPYENYFGTRMLFLLLGEKVRLRRAKKPTKFHLLKKLLVAVIAFRDCPRSFP